MSFREDNNNTVVSFDAHGLRLDTSDDAEVICSAMEGKQVEILILQGNTFGIEAAERVGLALAKQSALREAHFKDLFTSRGKEVVPEAMKHLLKGINDSGAQLILLDLSDNAVGPIGAPSVIEFLQSPSSETLEKLYLHNCGLGPEGSTSIAAMIPQLRNLREFICGRNRLEDKGASNMSKALSELRCLELIKLNQNGIRVDGITNLAEAFITHSDTLVEVDLSDNTIKEEGSIALAKFISRARKLKVLSLGDALILNKGFKEICKGLQCSPSLKNIEKINFEGNELHGNKIVDMIEEVFSVCKPDLELSLLENEFQPEELRRLETFSERFNILVDEVDSDDDEYDQDDDEDDDDEETDDAGSVEQRSERGSEEGSELSNGYVNVDGNLENELREISRDFIDVTHNQPFDAALANSIFIQLISRPNFQAVQILCEELGLIKCEQTKKKKELARDAIVYIGKNANELPNVFRDFFEVVVDNNDELNCGALLFKKLDI